MIEDLNRHRCFTRLAGTDDPAERIGAVVDYLLDTIRRADVDQQLVRRQVEDTLADLVADTDHLAATATGVRLDPDVGPSLPSAAVAGGDR